MSANPWPTPGITPTPPESPHPPGITPASPRPRKPGPRVPNALPRNFIFFATLGRRNALGNAFRAPNADTSPATAHQTPRRGQRLPALRPPHRGGPVGVVAGLAAGLRWRGREALAGEQEIRRRGSRELLRDREETGGSKSLRTAPGEDNGSVAVNNCAPNVNPATQTTQHCAIAKIMPKIRPAIRPARLPPCSNL